MNIQQPMKIIRAENFMRSAMPPTISAGVMIANVSWKHANTSWATQ